MRCLKLSDEIAKKQLIEYDDKKEGRNRDRVNSGFVGAENDYRDNYLNETWEIIQNYDIVAKHYGAKRGSENSDHYRNEPYQAEVFEVVYTKIATLHFIGKHQTRDHEEADWSGQHV